MTGAGRKRTGPAVPEREYYVTMYLRCYIEDRRFVRDLLSLLRLHDEAFGIMARGRIHLNRNHVFAAAPLGHESSAIVSTVEDLRQFTIDKCLHLLPEGPDALYQWLHKRYERGRVRNVLQRGTDGEPEIVERFSAQARKRPVSLDGFAFLMEIPPLPEVEWSEDDGWGGFGDPLIHDRDKATTWVPEHETFIESTKRARKYKRKPDDADMARNAVAEAYETAGYIFPDTAPRLHWYTQMLYRRVVYRERCSELAAREIEENHPFAVGCDDLILAKRIYNETETLAKHLSLLIPPAKPLRDDEHE